MRLLGAAVKDKKTGGFLDANAVAAFVANGKQEAAGSIPVSSSKELTEGQRKIFATIVYHRVAVEDQRKAIDEAKKGLTDAKVTYESAQKRFGERIESCTKQGQYHVEQLAKAETELKAAIVDEALRSATAVPVGGYTGPAEPTPAPAPVYDDMELGRSD